MEGGSTKPWLVEVETQQGFEPFVLKMYNHDHLKSAQVLKELLVASLIPQFDLKTPDCALINISNDLVENLEDKQVQQLRNTDNNPKFATKLIHPNYPYLEAKHFSIIEMHELGSIYAFDCLVMNADRRFGKPNLLFDNNNNINLIDHELCLRLDIPNMKFDQFINSYDYKKHLFYKKISNSRGDVADLFDTFHYFLSHLKLEKLTEVEYTLEDHGYDTDYFFRITDYLNDAKNNAAKFMALVIGSLKK